MIEAVIFDGAGVLTDAFSAELVAGALAAGADADVLVEVLYPLFADAGTGASVGNRLERGEISLEDFLGALGEHEPDVRLVLDPAAPTFFGHGFGPNLPMHQLVRDVKAAGLATALVSNNVREWQPTWDRVIPADLPFDVRLFSWQVGMRKPEPGIYRAALERLDVGAAATLYLDDFPAMVEGARRAGMRAIEVRDSAAAIAEVRALLSL